MEQPDIGRPSNIPQTYSGEGVSQIHREEIKGMDWHKLAERIFQNLQENNANPTIFKHYAKRVDRLLSIEQQALQSGANVDTLNKINAFAIHYLMKGAKFPLLHEHEQPRMHEQEVPQVHEKEKQRLQEQEIPQMHQPKKPLLGSPFHLSLLDYGAFTKPIYYRSEPSSIGTLYEEVLQKQGYGEIFEKCHVIPTKSVKWKRMLKGYFPIKRMVEIPIQEAPSKTDTAQETKVTREKGVASSDFLIHLGNFKAKYQELNTLNEVDITASMFDISPLLHGPKGSALAPDELSARVNAIKSVLIECNQDLKREKEIFPRVFGMAKLNDGQIALLLFKEKIESKIPPQQTGSSQGQQGTNAKSVDEAFKEELVKMLNKGYRSDLPKLEQSFIERGLTLPQIVALTKQILPPKGMDTVESTSVPTKTSSVEKKPLEQKKEEIAIKLRDLMQLGEQVSSKSGGSRKDFIYFGILEQIFNQIGREIVEKEDELMNAFVHQSLDIVDRKLHKLFTQMQDNKLPMEKLLSDVDLIFEEFILQLNFVSPANLKQTIIDRSQEGLDVPATGYACTSSMNAFAQLLPALYHSNGNRPLNVVSLDNIYFETVEFLNQAKTFFASNEKVKAGAPIPNLDNKDAVFVDFYPNNAPMKDVKQLPIPALIPPESLMRRDKPLTLVIDTSAGIFYEDEVKKVISQYQDAIKAGKLNIVVVNSLVKFAMCGVDKYQGGSLTVYNDAKVNHSAFNTLLEEYERKEPLSPQAAAFFNLFLSNPQLILAYKRSINENTTQMYDLLKQTIGPSTQNNGLTLVERPNNETPLIAIHFGKVIEQQIAKRAKGVNGTSNPVTLRNALSPVMRDYIVYQARRNGLPLSKRSSFGFAHSNISDTLTALRLTVGLESPAQLDAYANVLAGVNKELMALNDDAMKTFTLLAKNHSPKELSKAAETALLHKPANFQDMLRLMTAVLTQTK